MELHSHEHGPHKTGHNVFDLIISSCALFISALSIYMGWDTGHNMEKLVHASSWPFLQMGSGNVSDGDAKAVLSFGVSNAGTGPARIHTFQFVVDRKLIPAPPGTSGHLRRVLEACCGELYRSELQRTGQNHSKIIGNEYSNVIASSFLPAREKVNVEMWPRTEDNAALWKALDIARQKGRVTMRACYCSVFDECWIAETHAFPPRPVPSCPSPR